MFRPGRLTDSVGFQFFRRERPAARQFRLQRIVGHRQLRRRFRSARLRQLDGREERRERAEAEGDEPKNMVGGAAHRPYRNIVTVVGA